MLPKRRGKWKVYFSHKLLSDMQKVSFLQFSNLLFLYFPWASFWFTFFHFHFVLSTTLDLKRKVYVAFLLTVLGSWELKLVLRKNRPHWTEQQTQWKLSSFYFIFRNSQQPWSAYEFPLNWISNIHNFYWTSTLNWKRRRGSGSYIRSWKLEAFLGSLTWVFSSLLVIRSFCNFLVLS